METMLPLLLVVFFFFFLNEKSEFENQSQVSKIRESYFIFQLQTLCSLTLYNFPFLALVKHTFPLILFPFQICSMKGKALQKEHSALIVSINTN